MNKEMNIRKTIYKLFDENAFRVLGVYANASSKEVFDIYHRQVIRAKLNNIDGDENATWCLDRSEKTLRKALNSLKDPLQRAWQKLLWYRRESWMDANTIERLCFDFDSIQTFMDDNKKTNSYNSFISKYIFALATDREGKNVETWTDILEKISFFSCDEKIWQDLLKRAD